MSLEEAVKKAWLQEGINPYFHRYMQEKLKREWPTLYYAIVNNLDDNVQG